MATLDEILGGSPPNGGGNPPKGSVEWADQNSGGNTGGSSGNPPKGSVEWADQNSGGNAPVSSVIPPKQPTDKKPASTGGQTTTQSVGGYEDLLKKLNPYTPPTQEELEKERKRQKRESIIAAVSDGIAALSNLFFTTQGAPNMYTGKNTLSESTKVRYDKLIKERDEKNNIYFNAMMKAKQADADAAHRERSWQRQLGLDEEARKRHEESIQHRNEREKIADDRYAAEQEYKKGRDAESNRRWQETFDEDKRRSNRSYNFQVKQYNDSVTLKKEANKATAARGVRGKQLAFSDGKGNQVSIYENVWKGSMQQVYDVLYYDMMSAYKTDPTKNPRVPRHKTAQEKEDFVKQNWHKSPSASKIMLTLSKLDPAEMKSEINEQAGGLGWGSDNGTDW